MDNLTILLEADGISPDAVDVHWHAHLTQIPQAARGHIEQRWREYLETAQAQDKRLFNGPVTRFLNARMQNGRLLLDLGPSDYKTFLVTVLRDRAWFQAHAPEAIAPALGNSVLLTQGHTALLGIRSHHVSAYPDRAHLIGGVLDVLPEGQQSIAGILGHLRRELAEEAAIHENQLTPTPRLLAVVQDTFLMQPELIWQWEVTTDLHHIGAQMDNHEHSTFIIADQTALDPALRALMTPVACAAWQRWHSQSLKF